MKLLVLFLVVLALVLFLLAGFRRVNTGTVELGWFGAASLTLAYLLTVWLK